MVSALDFACVGLLPVAVAGGLVLVASRRSVELPTSWPLSLALGYAAGQFALEWQGKGALALQSLLNPHLARDWLPLAAILISALAAIGRTVRRPRWLILTLLFLLLAFLPARLLWHGIHVQSQWTAAQSGLWLGGLGIVSILFAVGFLVSASQPAPYFRWCLLILVSLGTSIILLLSGARVYALLAGAITAAEAGALIASAFLKSPQQISHAIAECGGVIAVVLGGMILLGAFYSDLTPLNAGLLLIAAVASVVALPRALTRSPVWHVVSRSLLSLIPLCIAFGHAVMEFAAAMAERADNPYL